jgi:hypothetical protein
MASSPVFLQLNGIDRRRRGGVDDLARSRDSPDLGSSACFLASSSRVSSDQDPGSWATYNRLVAGQSVPPEYTSFTRVVQVIKKPQRTG